MSRKKKGHVRRRMWERNPNCYWCGVATVWHEENGKQPDNAATIDHIRSKLSKERSQKDVGWQRGILVMSCYRCNNDRSKVEQAFMATEKPDEFRARSGSKKAKPALPRIQSELATTIMRYVEEGGTFDLEKFGWKIRKLAKRLRSEYRKHKQEPDDEDVSDSRGGSGDAGTDAAGPAGRDVHDHEQRGQDQVAASAVYPHECAVELRPAVECADCG